MDTDTFIYLRFAIWIGLALLTAKIASDRGRSTATWAIFGFMAPVLSLICALCLSKEPPPQKGGDPNALTTLSLTSPIERPKSDGSK